jgi:hypothetical protein
LILERGDAVKKRGFILMMLLGMGGTATPSPLGATDSVLVLEFNGEGGESLSLPAEGVEDAGPTDPLACDRITDKLALRNKLDAQINWILNRALKQNRDLTRNEQREVEVLQRKLASTMSDLTQPAPPVKVMWDVSGLSVDQRQALWNGAYAFELKSFALQWQGNEWLDFPTAKILPSIDTNQIVVILYSQRLTYCVSPHNVELKIEIGPSEINTKVQVPSCTFENLDLQTWRLASGDGLQG